MKAFTLIASTVAAVSMGAIGFTYAQSNTTGSTNPTAINPNSQAVTPGTAGTMGGTGMTGSTGASGTTGTTGAMRTDNMTNERMARADRN